MNLSADVLIVTATKVESQAVVEVFQGATGHAPSPISVGDRIYHKLGIINGTSVFMAQSEMGTGGLGASLLTVQKGIVALSPAAVIMVGIAFGVNSEKQSIGDILVSQRLMLYELQRVGTKEGGVKLIPRGDRPHASSWLFNRFQSADLYWDESKSKVRFGLILSGEKLVDNADFRQQLREFEPEAIGGEMEGAGLYVACQDAKVDWILVKAICDWADGHKAQDKDKRQRLAAHNAASLALHALLQAPLKREGERREPVASTLLDSRTNAAQVTVLLNKDLREFTSAEQASFVFALSRIVNIAPDQIQILRIVQGSVLVTLEMPEEAAKILLSLFLQQASALQTLQIQRVELKQLTRTSSDVHAESSQASVLFLAADPTNASRLRLGEELREIQEKLQLAKLREHFTLQQRMSVRPADVSQALLDVQPQIVHFSGHGAITGALYFENQVGEMQLVPSDAIATLFEQFSDKVKVVILNACYSATQASAIAQYIDYVIGMSREIGDKAAIAFSIGFYQALGAGRSIEEAYKLGCVQIGLQGVPEHLMPVLITMRSTPPDETADEGFLTRQAVMATGRKRRKSKDDASVEVTSTRSGGVDLDADTASIGGDVVGRDKILITGDLVKGDKIIQQVSEPIALSLHQLPPLPADFTGREDELNELMSNIEQGVIITGLRGMGGIGKTALALKLAGQLAPKYPDAQFFVELRGSRESISPADAMTRVIRAFYSPDAKLPDSEDELGKWYRSVLYDKRALLLLDDAKDASQVLPLLPPASCILLITSRQHFQVPGLHAKDLEQLPDDDARELILKIAPRIANVILSHEVTKNLFANQPRIPDFIRNNNKVMAVDVLAYLCGYLPQALRAAASLLALNEDLDPIKYIQDLRDERTRLERIGTEGVEISVEASLNLSYARLSDDAKQVFCKLAVFPASFDSAAEEYVCEDADHAHLSELMRLSSVQYDSTSKRFQLHDLARLFVDQHLSNDDRAAAQRRHAKYYEAVLRASKELYKQGGENIMRGLALFDLEWVNIQAGQNWAAAYAQEDDEATQLCNKYPDAGAHVLGIRQHPREKIRWLKDALSAARQLKDRSMEGRHLGNLGLAYADLGETRQAIELYEQQLKIVRDMGDRHSEGNALGNLGLAYAHLGKTRQAIKFYKQQLKIVRDMGDRHSEGNALCNLGLAYADLGKTRQAIELTQSALAIYRDSEIGDRYGEGAALSNLGQAYAASSEPGRAVESYRQALAIFIEIGDQQDEGETRFNLSLVLDSLGQRAPAIIEAQTALKIYEKIEDPRAEKVRQQLAEWRSE